MRIWKHPLFWMIINLCVILYINNLDVFLHIDERTFESIQTVLLPMVWLAFIMLTVSMILQIKIDIEENKKRNAK